MIAKLIMKYYQLIFHPKADGLISSIEIKHMFSPNKDIFCSDINYSIPRMRDIKDFLKLNIFKFRKFVPEKYDCDNYAFSLMGMFTNLMSGYAIGIIWVHTPRGNHALNFFIDQDRTLWYIEPQSDKVFQCNSYKPYFVIM